VTTILPARPCTYNLILGVLLLLTALTDGGCGGGSSSSGGSGGTPPPPPPPPSTTHVLNLAANQIVYDSSRKLIYASVGSTDTTHPNTVAFIDPASASVTTTIFVEADPNRLALSQDNAYLYVGTDGTNSVQRINLSSSAVDETIALGGALTAKDIQVMPGAAATIAVVRVPGPLSAFDVAIYDNTTMRSNTTASSRQNIDVIAFSDSGTTLYGLDSEVSDFSFFRMNVDSSGVSVQDANYSLLGWGYHGQMVYSSGLIFSTFGSVLNPSTLALQGRFPANPASLPNQQTTPFAESVIVDGGVPYLLTHDPNNGPTITAYDPQHFLETSAGVVKNSNSQGEHSLVTCGSNCFAFVGYQTTSDIVISAVGLTPVPTTTATLTNLMPNHILWDPGTARLYASVPAEAGSFGNSVAVIDPTTQTVETTIFAGSEPDALAVSSDSQYLYVGLDGAGSIGRINLSTHTIEEQYFLGSQPLEGPVFAQQIAVVPGSPHTYVAILRFKSLPSPNDAGTVVYDDGVQRPNTTAGNDMMTFSDSSSVLYGAGNQTSFAMNIMTIDSSGITITKSAPPNVYGSPVRLEFYSGILYSSNGGTLIPAIPEWAGEFSVGSARDVAVDGPGGNVYFLADDTSTHKAALLQYDLGKFVAKAYQDLPATAGSGSEIANCGANGFAVLLYPGIVFANGSFTALPPLGSSAANLTVNHLLWNATSGQIIASVPGYIGPDGNSIALIDPNSQTITSSFFVGSEPDPMALSSDGNTLYVGLDGSGSVAQVDLKAGSVTYNTSLGFLFAQYLSVNPINSNMVAVSRSRGVAILDQGTILPNVSDSPFNAIDSITFGNSGTNLYAYDNTDSGFYFYRLSVDASGVSLIDSYGRIFYGFNANIQNHDGLIYSSNGTVANPAVPQLQGMFLPYASPAISGFFDDTTNEAYFLQYDPTKSPASAVLRYNLKNYSYIDATPLSAVTGQGWDLIRYGTNNIALATSSGLSFATISTATPPAPSLSNLTVRHLLNDAARSRIYATVPGTVPTIGNSVAIINPANSSIVATIPVGSEPDVMALSADGAYLYVGLDGGGSIARVNLATNAVDQTFSVGVNPVNGAETPQSISVSPTDSTVIAVARAFPTIIPDQAGVAIFSNEAMLPDTTASLIGSGAVAFCSSGSTLYGFDNQTTGFGFYTMSVNSNGVQQTSEVPNLIVGVANIICDSNVVYASTGYAVDPLNNTQLGIFSGMHNPSGMAIDDTNKKVFFLDTNSVTNAVTINGFDQTSYSLTGTLSVNAASSAGRDLVRWGTNGFAVATQDQVLLMSGTLP
jgi:DNA-binding beta-propeller fold protein YncE